MNNMDSNDYTLWKCPSCGTEGINIKKEFCTECHNSTSTEYNKSALTNMSGELNVKCKMIKDRDVYIGSVYCTLDCINNLKTYKTASTFVCLNREVH